MHHAQEQGELAPLFSDLKAALQHFSDALARECDKRYAQVCALNLKRANEISRSDAHALRLLRAFANSSILPSVQITLP